MTLSDAAIADRIGRSPTDRNRLEIAPFVPGRVKPPGHPSHGVSSYGVDLRLGYNFLYLDEHAMLGEGISYLTPDTARIPYRSVRRNPAAAEPQLYIIPGKSLVLGETLERVRMPRDCWGLVLGKSTWARLGIDLNTTMIEPEWEGHITIEITNNSPVPVGLTCGDGICQLVMMQGGPPSFPLVKSYADHANPTYQGQTGVTGARV